jgi:hypothetical protein
MPTHPSTRTLRDEAAQRWLRQTLEANMTETSPIETKMTETSKKDGLPVEFEMLSKYQRRHLTISGIGLVVAICAFGAVFLQVHNLTEQTRRQTVAIDLQREAVRAQSASLSAQLIATEAQVWQTIGAQQVELSKVMISNAELRPYFAEGKPIVRTDKKLQSRNGYRRDVP